MRPFSTLLLASVLISLVCFASSASATIIFQDDFERLAKDTAVSTVTPLVGLSYTPAAGVVKDTTTNPPGVGAGGSSRFVDCASAAGDWMQPTAAGVALTVGQVVTTEFDMYSVYNGSTSIQYLSPLAAVEGAGNTWAGQSFQIGVGTNGSLRKYEGGADWVNVAPAGTVRSNTWIHVKVDTDFAAKSWAATVDGYNFAGTFVVPTANKLGSCYFSGAELGTIFYDNVSISIIPEPSTLALLASGLIGLLCYAWRKRR